MLDNTKVPVFDGKYHCGCCDKVFRIAERVEFIKHQKHCKKSVVPQNEMEKER